MTYSLDITIPGLPPMNTSDGGNWQRRFRAKKRWEREVFTATRGMLPEKPLDRARVTITRHSGSRRPDFENLTQGGKALLDGLVKVGVIADDRPEVIGQPDYLWEPAPPKHGKVRIQVWDRGVEIGDRVEVGDGD